MSLHLTFGCDGNRFRQPCRGRLHTKDTDFSSAYRIAAKAGWRKRYISGKGVWLCPSPNHDEDKTDERTNG